MNVLQIYKRVRKDMMQAEREAGGEIVWNTPRLIHLIQKYIRSRDKALACYMFYLGPPIREVLKRRRERSQLSFRF